MTALIPCMMAHEVGAAKFEPPFDDNGWIAQQKLDGYRAQLHLHPGGPNELWSRTAHDMIEGVPFLQELRADRNVVLDGELVAENGGGSHDVNHWLAAKTGLVYAAFDILQLGDHDCQGYTLGHRMDCLLAAGVFSARLFSLPYEMYDKRGLYDRTVLQGGEGVVLKRVGAIYQAGKRSWDWLKVKKTETYDVVITDCDSKPTQWTVRPGAKGTDGVVYPDGKLSSTWLAGYCGLSYGLYDPVAKEIRRVGSLGVTGPKEEMELYVGRVVEVKGWGQYKKTGAIRHPQMVKVRTDKLPVDCLFPGFELDSVA